MMRQAIEGILRSVKERHSCCDICFVYATHVSCRSEILAVVSLCEEIADHDGTQSRNAGDIVRDLVESGD